MHTLNEHANCVLNICRDSCYSFFTILKWNIRVKAWKMLQFIHFCLWDFCLFASVCGAHLSICIFWNCIFNCLYRSPLQSQSRQFIFALFYLVVIVIIIVIHAKKSEREISKKISSSKKKNKLPFLKSTQTWKTLKRFIIWREMEIKQSRI